MTEWGGDMSVGCSAGLIVSWGQAVDGRILRCVIIGSCHPAATSEILKRFWLRVTFM